MTGSDAMGSRAAARVVHLAQSDREGGANRAAFRLHQALREAGVSSIFHAGRKLSSDPSVVPAWPRVGGRTASEVVARLNALALRAYPARRPAAFSPVRLAYGRPHRDLIATTDVICLHWIAGAFLRPSALTRLGRPLVWRLSDLWPFTGGCHYPADCLRFAETCGHCPALGSPRDFDLSRLDFLARRRAYASLDLVIVAPSRWIADHARRSSLFGGRRIEHIATGVDLALYRPHDRAQARAHLGLPADRRIVLFGALAATDDRRKGYHHMQAALQALSASGKAGEVMLVVFGGKREAAMPEGFPLPALHVGQVTDETHLSKLYAAADVFVAPFEEDNLPNVVLEALACGTPVVSFAAGGIPDSIDHGENGYLAPLGATEELARGILWTMENADRGQRLRLAARAVAQARFDLATCAGRYRDLFNEIAARNRPHAA